MAPLFALAPIAGCALAGKVRQSALNFPAAGPAEPLTAPNVTFAQPEAPVSPGGTTPIVPVVPAGN
ncbi:MAG: hypothetical protein DWI01_04515 [Planctomycetota bacterium]|nr:MAG: hypothetical protein DWI01_04515 [Planctomycetota bacterium]